MTMKKILTMILVCCAALMAQAQTTLPSLHVDGKWLVDTYGNHVVLHGVMDTPSNWFNGYTDANGHHSYWSGGYDNNGAKNCVAYFGKILAALKEANCDVFRLHLDPAWTNDNNVSAPGFTTKTVKENGKDVEKTYDPIGQEVSGEANIRRFNPKRLSTFMKSVYIPIMMKALENGMYVVVRPPGVCPGDIRVDGYYQRYLVEVWDSVTKNETIRKYAGQISIELANEPVSVKNASGTSYDSNNSGTHQILRDFFQPVVDKIRENGFTGIIWLPGSGWQSNYVGYKKYPINDPLKNFGYAVHDYTGWYECSDESIGKVGVTQGTKNKINKFHSSVPVLDSNPIIVTEIDWSPYKEGTGHYNEHGDWVLSNYGTWSTGTTSKWGNVTKGVYENFGNISMTLSGTACLIDILTLLNKKQVVPAFGGIEEACGKACMDWYAEYAKVNNPEPDWVNNAPISDLGNGKYKNPVVRADFPDPDVIRVGDTYYMVSTTMSLFPGATILKSKDMVNWEYCAQPLQQMSEHDGYLLKNDKNAYACGMWAPSMKYYDGKFYVLICERYPVENWSLNGYLLTAENPEGKWTMKKLSRAYYDPGMLFDTDGKIYIVQGIGNLSVCQVDKNFNTTKEQTVISGKDGLEGSHFYKKGKYYYIYSTYGGYPSGQAVFRSTSPFGPYEERMVLEKTINGKANTIHQGSLIQDVKGNWWTIMQQDLGALGRFPNLQPVKWINDWPVVGNEGVPYDTYDKPATSEEYPFTRYMPTTDNFRNYPLDMQWEWNHTPDADGWSLFERGGWLRLKTTGVASRLPEARNMLTQRVFMDVNKTTPTIGTVRIDVSRLQEGDRAGISLFQDPFAAIAVEIKNGQPLIVWFQDKVKGADANSAKESYKQVELTDNIIYLRAAIKYGEDKAMFYYSTDNKTWNKLGSDTQQSFNLNVFFGARFGLFCYSTKSAGGIADFDWFSTEDGYDEDALYQPFKATLDEKMFTVTKIVPSKSTVDAMIGGFNSPGIVATFQDKHTENVTTLTAFEPAETGIVEFSKGQMKGLAYGSTRVKATYTDNLGNTVDTAFTARASYFPFDEQFVTANVAGTNTYKFYNTTNGDYAFFKFGGAGNQIGWLYPSSSKLDLSGYHYMVIKNRVKPTSDFTCNFHISSSATGTQSAVPMKKNALETVICLDTLKYTTKNNYGKALNRKMLTKVTFQAAKANTSLTVTEILLYADDPTGINEVAWKQERQQRQTVNVYTLSGRMVRRAVNRSTALQGLPAGLYLVDGQKIVVR